jgi:phytoene dehydrogenase-like protein
MSAPTVVIGAGADELVAAHLLARAGHRVVVLGQGIAPESTTGWIPPGIVDALGLAERGLRFEHADPWAVAPLPGGGRLELCQDAARSAASIARVSARDAAQWPAFCARMARLARLLESIYAAPPPDPVSRERGELARLARLAWRTRRLGREGLTDLLRLLPMPVADLLDDWFENDTLKGLLGAAALAQLRRGPRAGGTAFALLHRHVGNAPGVFRAPRSNADRVLAALPGVEIRPDATVARIAVHAGRVTAVVLASGAEMAASRIVSGLDPHRTLLRLLEPGWLDPESVRTVRNIRARGVVAELTLAVEREPEPGTLVIAPSLDYLERAADDAKYGRVSQRPVLDAHAVGPRQLEVRFQYAPYALAEGAWDGPRRDALARLAVATLAEHVPAPAGAIDAIAVRSPLDLEAMRGWPEGQSQHAELALDQALWMRPAPTLARYRTPVGGLYLCGPAMHPGAGVAGAAGANAARAILREDGRGSGR